MILLGLDVLFYVALGAVTITGLLCRLAHTHR